MSLVIRQASEEDVVDIATVHVAGWQGAYGGIIDQDFLDSHTIESQATLWDRQIQDAEKDNAQIWLAYQAEKPVGFVAYGSLRTAPPGTSKIRPLYTSEIYGLYLIPDVFRQGIGTRLMRKAVENLRAQKHRSMCLWVLEKNKRARGFYEAMQGQRIGKLMVEFGPTKEKELCYGWRDISVISAL